MRLNAKTVLAFAMAHNGSANKNDAVLHQCDTQYVAQQVFGRLIEQIAGSDTGYLTTSRCNQGVDTCNDTAARLARSSARRAAIPRRPAITPAWATSTLVGGATKR